MSPKTKTSAKIGKAFLAASVFWIAFLVPSFAQAGSIYLNIPSIPGVDPAPGYPDAISVQSFTLSSIKPAGFSIIRDVDKTSPELLNAVAKGTPIPTVSALIYNTPHFEHPVPVLSLSFTNVLASSYTLLGGGQLPREKVDFTFPLSDKKKFYADVPGITGTSFLPGFPNVMEIQSFSLTNNTFTVIKGLDSASAQIAKDAAAGTVFSTASFLIYNSSPTGPPDATLVFQNLVISGNDILDTGGVPQEQVTFSFEDFAPAATPEPSSLALLSIGAVAMVAGALRRGRRR